MDAVCVSVCEAEDVALGVADSLGVSVREGDDVVLGLLLAEAVCVSEGVTLHESVGD